MADIMGAVGSIAFMAILAWIIRIFQTNRRVLKLASMQVDMQTRLIDKFDNATDRVSADAMVDERSWSDGGAR